ncbi:Lrp/AsnC family transcriptional regulator [Lichenifustis flavocetrariae]|uniref:Lrp/AsnC family transcriptional regulator n=1 Tax=Lichenifustis flavocetrariae TaxID=2949735 RepID=A0AA41YX58_9HYPH|nr:Lrp/AsnC family transcriptional regulator [Lichenifustis flavocetrariae]MCW6509759.1 Lrp/AsnC family transcriptional regulator [Lichenifustis flavocetrariae]
MLPDIDAKDLAILEALQEDGRISLALLGRRIGLSQPAMSERVKRLEERGIITGYGARISADALGLRMMAIIRLKTAHEHIKACLQQFAELSYVIEVHRVTGEDCFILKVLVPAPEDLATIVDAIGRFGVVTTAVVLRSEPPKAISRTLMMARRR